MSLRTDTADISTMGLPPVLTGPLATDDPVLAGLTVFERRLLDDQRGEHPVRLLVATGSRADTGLWFRRARLYLACLDDRLLLFAYGLRPHVEPHHFGQLRGSIVNAITGELVLAPEDALVPTRTIRLPLSDAYQVYAQIMAMENPTQC